MCCFSDATVPQSSSTDTVTIRFIGAGAIARWHAQAAARLPVKAILQAADPDPAALQAFVAQFPQARAFADVQIMLSQPRDTCDIVVNAAPPAFHASASIAALESGRHVLCEKPLAINRDEALSMLAAAQRNNVWLGCCSDRFCGLPAVKHVRGLLDSGALGHVYHMSFINRLQRARSGVEYQPKSRWFLDPLISGGGVLMDWGPYDMAALVELLRPIQATILNAWLSTPRTGRDPRDIPLVTEQHVAASLLMRCADGHDVAVTYERASCTHGEPRSLLELEGVDGAVRWQWPGGQGQVTRAFDVGGDVRTEQSEFPDASGLHPHDKPLVYFHRRIAGKDSPAIVNEQAVFNFLILQGIYEAARTGRAITVVPPSVRGSSI